MQSINEIKKEFEDMWNHNKFSERVFCEDSKYHLSDNPHKIWKFFEPMLTWAKLLTFLTDELRARLLSRDCRCQEIARLYPNSKQKLCGRCAMVRKIDADLEALGRSESQKVEALESLTRE